MGKKAAKILPQNKVLPIPICTPTNALTLASVGFGQEVPHASKRVWDLIHQNTFYSAVDKRLAITGATFHRPNYIFGLRKYCNRPNCLVIAL